MTVGPPTSIRRTLGAEALLVVHAGKSTVIARAETSTEAALRMTANAGVQPRGPEREAPLFPIGLVARVGCNGLLGALA